jgi:hypothetical protein
MNDAVFKSLSIYLSINSLYDSDDCSVPYRYTLIATDVCLNFSTSGNSSSNYLSCDGAGERCCREHHTINSSYVSCNDAIQSPPSAGTYSEYDITAKSFDSDVCAATSFDATFQRHKKVCDDEYPYDDDYYADDDYAARVSNSTRYSNYCLLANRAPSSTPSSRPSYGYGSPTPAPTKFKGVKFSASQVSNAHCLSVCLLVFR